MARFQYGDKFNAGKQMVQVDRELSKMRGNLSDMFDEDGELYSMWDDVENEERFGRGAPKKMNDHIGW